MEDQVRLLWRLNVLLDLNVWVGVLIDILIYDK